MVAKSQTWDGPVVTFLKLAKKVCPIFNSYFLFLTVCDHRHGTLSHVSPSPSPSDPLTALLTADCVLGFLHREQFSATPAGCPEI